MLMTVRKESPAKAVPRDALASPALEWLWKFLADVRHPHVFDCGPPYQSTLDVLLTRGAKIYVADLVSPLQRGGTAFWDRSGKQPIFRLNEFLAQAPEIPAESVSIVFCWHLLDLLPRGSVPEVVERLYSCLQPGGALFFLLREPYLAAGSQLTWRLGSLTVLGSAGRENVPFPYPAITNREIERLFPAGAVKTFLTRSGRREVLALK
jgi:hypothetical protein